MQIAFATSQVFAGGMGFKIFKRGCLEDPDVPMPVLSRTTALIAAHHGWKNTRNKPLVDSGSGDDFDQWNPVVAAATVHPEMHRGGQTTPSAPSPTVAQELEPFVPARAQEAQRAFLACSDFCHSGRRLRSLGIRSIDDRSPPPLGFASLLRFEFENFSRCDKSHRCSRHHPLALP